MKPERLFKRLMVARTNVRFADFVRLIEAFGFRHDRTSGSHRIYIHDRVPTPLSLQPVNGQAKPYQIRQFLELVEAYDLSM